MEIARDDGLLHQALRKVNDVALVEIARDDGPLHQAFRKVNDDALVEIVRGGDCSRHIC